MLTDDDDGQNFDQNSSIVTLSVIKSLNVIIITHRGENATLSVIKLNCITYRCAIATLSVIKHIFITLGVAIATLYIIIITFRVGLVHVRKNVYKSCRYV